MTQNYQNIPGFPGAQNAPLQATPQQGFPGQQQQAPVQQQGWGGAVPQQGQQPAPAQQFGQAPVQQQQAAFGQAQFGGGVPAQQAPVQQQGMSPAQAFPGAAPAQGGQFQGGGQAPPQALDYDAYDGTEGGSNPAIPAGYDGPVQVTKEFYSTKHTNMVGLEFKDPAGKSYSTFFMIDAQNQVQGKMDLERWNSFIAPVHGAEDMAQLRAGMGVGGYAIFGALLQRRYSLAGKVVHVRAFDVNYTPKTGKNAGKPMVKRQLQWSVNK
jgi:hypothetical protein